MVTFTFGSTRGITSSAPMSPEFRRGLKYRHFRYAAMKAAMTRTNVPVEFEGKKYIILGEK